MKKTLFLAVLGALVAAAAVASEEDDLTSLSYISYVERYATIRSVAQDETVEAVINMPLVPGDRVDTARQARMEIQLADGSTLWLDEYTSVSFDAVAYSRGAASTRTVLFFQDGVAVLEIPETALGTESLRVDTPSATVYLTRPGLYRLEALRTGGLRVEVWEGMAQAATPEGGAQVLQGTAAEVGGGSVQRTESMLTTEDGFARWVEERRGIPADAGGLRLEARYARQEATLNSYGGWLYVEELGTWGWQPSVGVGWSPYTYGYWYWAPAGWCWVSYEPWGWLPYHYGSWYFSVSLGWVWSWGSYWGPAWVDWVWWPGYVGWCPRGYYDYWYWHSYPPSHGPGYPGGRPPAAAPRPGARRSVPPPGRGVDRVGNRPPVDPGRFALGFEGEGKVRNIDPRGWNVVRTSDFTNPNLPRLVTPGREVFPKVSDDVRGVIRSGPLLTGRPSGRPAAEVIEQPFREAQGRALPDLTPILARNGSLDRETVRGLVRETTPAALTREAMKRSGLPSRDTGIDTRIASRTGDSPGNPGSGRSGAGWGAEGAAGGSRGMPNIYRPTLGRTASGGVTGRPSGDRRLGSPSGDRSSGDPRRGLPGSRTPGTVRSPGGTTRTPTGSTRSPSAGSRPERSPSLSGGWGSRTDAGTPGRPTPGGGSGVSPSGRTSPGTGRWTPRTSGGSPRTPGTAGRSRWTPRTPSTWSRGGGSPARPGSRGPVVVPRGSGSGSRSWSPRIPSGATRRYSGSSRSPSRIGRPSRSPSRSIRMPSRSGSSTSRPSVSRPSFSRPSASRPSGSGRPSRK